MNNKFAGMIRSAGLTYRTLGEKLGRSKAPVNDWCNGHRAPELKPSEWVTMAQALDVDMSELLSVFPRRQKDEVRVSAWELTALATTLGVNLEELISKFPE